MFVLVVFAREWQQQRLHANCTEVSVHVCVIFSAV